VTGHTVLVTGHRGTIGRALLSTAQHKYSFIRLEALTFWTGMTSSTTTRVTGLARSSPVPSPSPPSTKVVSKRMVKKQQMRWTPRGAQLLLQVRTRVLNDDLADQFRRWHPGFTHTIEGSPAGLAVAA